MGGNFAPAIDAMRRVGNSWTVKLLMILVLVLTLLIPMAMIKEMIAEREMRRQGVVTEVSSKWGKEQTVAGPILSVPYTVAATDASGRKTTTTAHAHLLPDHLTITGVVKPEIRYRGIYEVVLYNAEVEVNADFKKSGLADLGIPESDVQWQGATVSVGLPDLRGVKENNVVYWNEEAFPIGSGISMAPVMESGISSRVPVSARQETYRFRMRLSLNGSGQIGFLPIGKVTTVQLESPWKSPSFTGPFLPDERVVNDRGFSAKWKILHLNRNYPQQWIGKNEKAMESVFGAKFFWPVDEYQKTTRAVKYAVLFILLTLTAFFLAEVTTCSRLHPVQYLLIGFAVCLFYLLLLSVSEHAGFDVAYLVASVASISLVAGYSWSILRSGVIATTIACLMGGLYGFLYITIQAEDYALLIGGAGMFIVLSAIMYLTRKIDWYAMTPGGPIDLEEEWTEAHPADRA